MSIRAPDHVNPAAVRGVWSLGYAGVGMVRNAREHVGSGTEAIIGGMPDLGPSGSDLTQSE
jgi:hypothetical protein